MSFLEWRRFNFFNLRKDVDNGNIAQGLGGTSVTATSSGHGTITICDSEGVIHLVNRNFQITTFQGYLISVSFAAQPKSVPILVTIGEDEIGSAPLIKVWDIEKQDRQGNPVCLKNLKAFPNNKNVKASALSVSDTANMMAVGFVNGAIILYRGNLIRGRSIKSKVLRDEQSAITGLAFKTTGKKSHLFVSTKDSVLQYNITVKDREEEVFLDKIGCPEKCSVLADSFQDYPFIVAKQDAIYCYTTDGLGPCYVVDGPKVCLQWFRTYLIIVAEDSKAAQSPVVSSTTSEENNTTEKGRYVITVLDIQNKFIVFTMVLQEIVAVLSEWGSFYILTKDHQLHHFLEKDLKSKLELLFKKNLYDISLRIAKNQQHDSDSLIEIFRQYGDHLYSKGEYNGAIDHYIKTIGKLEPSYVIRKFLDSQHIDNLIKYLSALHKLGVATGDHTTLLLNCYTKLNDIHKLKEFILTKNREIEFDINIAISVCRKSSSEDALILTKKYGLHLWYVKILLEDQKNYDAALQYIAKLEFTEAHEMVLEFGDAFMKNIPSEFTEFLKKLCTCYYPADTLLLDQGNQIPHQADPQDFIHLFLNNSMKMVEFLEYITQFSNKWNTSVYNTLIEHHLQLWFNSKEIVDKFQYERKVMTTLQSSEINYDKNQALILCTMRQFKPGLLYLLEENKQYRQILKYQLNTGCYEEVVSCCRKFSYQEPSLWVFALKSAASDQFFPSDILCEILTVIEKENLLQPLQVVDIVSRSKTLTIGDIKNYFQSILKTESKIIDEENASITKYKEETQRMREHIKKIKNNQILFQGSFCSACKKQLELPSVHFLCQHSYHQYCYQSYVDENESECPMCLPANKKILGVIKSQEKNRDISETFHSQLERAHDPFSLIADYLGRNIFSKISVDPQLTKKIKSSLTADVENINNDNLISFKLSESVKIKEQKAEVNGQKSTLEAHISPLRESPVNLYSGESLMNAVENKRSVPSTNPFENEEENNSYDEKKNPFFEGNDSDDDYDKSLNPFV